MAEPAVTVAAYHLTPGNNMPVGRIVIHTTSPPNVPFPVATAPGKARQTALYFTLASSGGSAHYVVDQTDEEHCLRDNQIAWHAPPNRYSLGIEICGQTYYTREQWLSADVWPAVQLGKARALELSQRHGVPWTRIGVDDLRKGARGVCGHVDVSNAFHQSNHTDPGDGFPWDLFMELPAPHPLPPVVTFPEDHLMRIPVQLPQTSGGAGYWELDGAIGDGSTGYPRPAVLFDKWTGARPTVNGQYHKAPAGPEPSVTVCQSDNGFAEIGFSGFAPNSAPLLFLEIAS